MAPLLWRGLGHNMAPRSESAVMRDGVRNQLVPHPATGQASVTVSVTGTYNREESGSSVRTTMVAP